MFSFCVIIFLAYLSSLFFKNYVKRAKEREMLLKTISSPNKGSVDTKSSPIKSTLPSIRESPIKPILAERTSLHLNTVPKPSPVKTCVASDPVTSVPPAVKSAKVTSFSPARKLFTTSSPVKSNFSPKPSPRKPLSSVNAMVDKDDPSVLPLSARRALFEQKIRNERIRAMPVSPTNHCEPEAKKSRTITTEQIPAKVLLESKECKIESKENVPDDKPQVSSPPEEIVAKSQSIAIEKVESHVKDRPVIVADSPKKTTDVVASKEEIAWSPVKVPSDVNHEKESAEVAEALAAFKEIDEYSVASNDTSHFNTLDGKSDHKYHADLVKTSSDSHNTSASSNVSSIIENCNEILSPIHNSTRLYPELPLSNELSPVDRLLEDELDVKKLQSPAIREIKKASMPPSSSCSSPSTPVRTLSMYRREQKIRACKQQNEMEKEDLNTTMFIQANRNKLMEQYMEFRAKKIQNLQKEAEVLNSIIFQSMRALDLCKQKHNLCERVEAEKILLVNCKKPHNFSKFGLTSDIFLFSKEKELMCG